ncbi:MAG: lysostaphin resistance A-like protein, partial [Caulobacteraceae bacterium]
DGVERRDRDPGRIAAAILFGLAAGLLAAFAAMILVLVAYLVLTGNAGEGLAGIHAAALTMRTQTGTHLGPTILFLAATTTGNLALAVAFVALAAILAHHALSSYVTSAKRARWRLLLAGLVLGSAILIPFVLVNAFTSPPAPTPMVAVSSALLGRTAYVAASIFFLIIAAAAEELFFRGWLMRQLAAFSRRPLFLILATSFLFSAAHLDFSPGPFVTRIAMGAGLAYMTLRLGGIEFSTGVHAANNILIVLFIEPLSLKAVMAPSGASDAWLIGAPAILIAFVAITEAVARIGVVRRLAGIGSDEIAA